MGSGAGRRHRPHHGGARQGADVNAKARYDVTALIFAAGNGRLEAVKLLLARGADINAQDTFYRARAADMATTNGHTESRSTSCRTAPTRTASWPAACR